MPNVTVTIIDPKTNEKAIVLTTLSNSEYEEFNKLIEQGARSLEAYEKVKKIS